MDERVCDESSSNESDCETESRNNITESSEDEVGIVGREGHIDAWEEMEVERKKCEKPYFCVTCKIGIGRSHDFQRHMETVHRNAPSDFVCVCGAKPFSRKDALTVLNLLLAILMTCRDTKSDAQCLRVNKAE